MFAPWGFGREWREALEDEAEAVQDIAAFEAMLPESTVAVVRYGPHGHEMISDLIRPLRRRNPTVAFVAIAPFLLDVASDIVSVGYSGVVWECERPDSLSLVVRHLRNPDPRGILGRLWEAGDGLREPIPRTAFRRLVDPDATPITTVQELSRQIAVPESTLRAHWGREFPECSPSEVIRQILLVRGIPLLDDGRSTVGAAVALGVHEDTLDRISKKFSGHTFRSQGSDAVRRRTLELLAECARGVFGDGVA